MSAIGGVLRNNMGHCICVFSIPIPPIEMNSAAVMAIFRAINPNNNVLWELEKIRLIVESDSSNAVRWCNEDFGGPWNLNFQLNYIRNARHNWMDIEIIHKGGGSNVVADTLAKQGLTRDAEFMAWIWFKFLNLRRARINDMLGLYPSCIFIHLKPTSWFPLGVVWWFRVSCVRSSMECLSLYGNVFVDVIFLLCFGIEM